MSDESMDIDDGHGSSDMEMKSRRKRKKRILEEDADSDSVSEEKKTDDHKAKKSKEVPTYYAAGTRVSKEFSDGESA
jgi:hypothetical protein